MQPGSAALDPWRPRAFAVTQGDASVLVDDKQLDLPVDNAVAASLVARFGNRVSSAHIDATLAQGLKSVQRFVKGVLVPEGPFTLALSQLALDTLGGDNTLSFTPLDSSPPGTFGRLLFVLPSDYDGGKVCVDHQDVDLAPHRILALYNATSLTTAPVTRGYRAILVYHLIYTSPTAHVRCAPASDADALDAWLCAAASANSPAWLYAYALRGPISNLAFNALCPADLRLVRDVAASGRFDVCLAHLRDGVYDEWKILSEIAPYPWCGLSTAAAVGLIGQDVCTSMSTCLVVWRTTSRLHFASVDAALSALEAAVNDAPVWGYVSRKALAAAVISTYAVVATSSMDRARLTATLSQLDDVGLVQSFLGRYWHTHLTPVATVAPWIHAQLVRFGWTSLAESLSVFVYHARSVGAPAFVASLAGLGDLCPALDAPKSLELLKQLYHKLLSTCDVWRHDVATQVDTVAYLIMLEMHLDRAHESGHWLAHRLPPHATACIDAYLARTATLSTVLTKLPRFEVVVPALVLAQDRAPQLMLGHDVARYTALLAKIPASIAPEESGDHELVAATIAHLRWHHLNVKALEACMAKASFLAIPAFLWFAREHRLVQGDSEISLLAAGIAHVVAQHSWSEHRIAQARLYYHSLNVEASVAVDAFTFFAHFAPSEMRAFAQTWLSSTTSYRPIYHLLKDHSDVLRRHTSSSVYADVVQAGIDRMHQGRLQPDAIGRSAAEAMAYFLQCHNDVAGVSVNGRATST
ncbi:hypothetical protein SDRG_11425 [Saprolegnia diclina VS20]|uniref:Uncharacterized protein n=1 Tax=Saprolegnia diclina (strain VS20) TaxID=1156394 RepID=T0RLW9_SAPDV|nr:hypothetical protein SDRG_11425 [Saprolegnia diclina VS20]EQC30952.1 hypothetical protein SDRG_11425 [Saprolegnia diclina VS20]|eukprot:XP_008615690.1 hypothetical protein SDRG_11425 [Saprolegnia diclina VS20]